MTSEQPQQLFGALAVEMQFITPAQLQAAIARQTSLQDMLGVRMRMADMLIEQGMITSDQRDLILARQAGKRMVGKFELIRKLGEGGMGAVYLARQVSMDRDVALKILSPKLALNPTFRERFLSEARAVARLNHPNIVRGYDVGHSDGVYFFAMEYVDGGNLGDLTGGRKTVPWRHAIVIGRQCAGGLRHAAENGVIHLDIKPDNLLIYKDPDEGWIVKITDLGLAWLANEKPADGSERKAYGSPHYMSPEQALADSVIDFRSDIYSLGLTLHRLLTGERPFSKMSAREAMAAHVHNTIPSPSDCGVELPDSVSRILECMTAKDFSLRYQSWDAVIDDFDAVIKENEPLALGMVVGESTIAPPIRRSRRLSGFQSIEDRETNANELPGTHSARRNKTTKLHRRLKTHRRRR